MKVLKSSLCLLLTLLLIASIAVTGVTAAQNTLTVGTVKIGGLFADDEQVVSKAVEGAREALLSMGFTSAEADLALKGAPEDGTESTLLQYALKKLGA